MGIIKEPKGINFAVDPKPLTAQDKKEISEIIAFYKATGKKLPKVKPSTKRLKRRSNLKNTSIV